MDCVIFCFDALNGLINGFMHGEPFAGLFEFLLEEAQGFFVGELSAEIDLDEEGFALVAFGQGGSQRWSSSRPAFLAH